MALCWYEKLNEMSALVLGMEVNNLMSMSSLIYRVTTVTEALGYLKQPWKIFFNFLSLASDTWILDSNPNNVIGRMFLLSCH